MSGLRSDLAARVTDGPHPGVESPLAEQILVPDPSGRDLLLWKPW
jgi:hypothetical protein